MNISSEVQGRHTVGDKTCGCQPSGLRHIFILSAMSLSLALLFPKDSKKTILTKGRSSDLSSLPRVAFPFIEQWLRWLGDCPIRMLLTTNGQELTAAGTVTEFHGFPYRFLARPKSTKK